MDFTLLHCAGSVAVEFSLPSSSHLPTDCIRDISHDRCPCRTFLKNIVRETAEPSSCDLLLGVKWNNISNALGQFWKFTKTG